MSRVLLALLVAAALGAAAFLLLRDDAGRGGAGGALSRDGAGAGEEESLSAPGLQGSGRGPRPRPEPPAPPPSTVPQPPVGEVLAVLRVVDAESGAALPGAHVWFEPAREPCPRLPGEEYLRPPPGPLSSRAVVRHVADAEGAFALDTARFARPAAPRLDVFAEAPGYVLGLACGVELGGATTTIRLKRGRTLAGRVLDLAGKPLAGAVVLARPAATAPPVPGNAGWAPADEQGRFAIGGLGDGPLTLTAALEGWFPQTLPAEDPREERERVFRLAPAFVLAFRLRTDDGRPPENPTVRLVWGEPPQQSLELLSLLSDEDADGRLTTGLAMPATAPTVAIEVKADGYAPFRQPAEPVPPEGGARTLKVLLARDTGQGGLTLVFEDEGGRTLDFRLLRALPPTITPLSGQDLAGGVVLETSEALRFPSLPPGRYRVGVRMFAYAPALAEGTVVAGTPTEVRTRLRPAGRLKVRFTAPAARIVRFRLVQGATVIPALPEQPVALGADGGEEPVLAAGEGGLLLGGLASGSYVVEVLSEDLLRSRTSVSVREGDTEEVEIRVQTR